VIDLERMRRIRWFHTIELAPGVRTPGLVDCAAQLRTLGLPADLSGRSVLDIGAWDGFYSFEAERRGAARVVASDSFAWSEASWSSKEGFRFAREALGSRVQDVEVDVMDLSPASVGGTFDVVLFLGVLYHLRDPLGALERVAAVLAAGGLLVLETHVDLVWTRRPALAFYPRGELGGDPTNWFGPNPAAVRGMLAAVGLRDVSQVFGGSAGYRALRYGRRALRYAAHLARERRPPAEHPSQGRAVFHARR
jgi:tRNA (mo5U34)-methyltransferase